MRPTIANKNISKALLAALFACTLPTAWPPIAKDNHTAAEMDWKETLTFYLLSGYLLGLFALNILTFKALLPIQTDDTDAPSMEFDRDARVSHDNRVSITHRDTVGRYPPGPDQ